MSDEWEETAICYECCKYVKDDGVGPCPECGAPRLTEDEADNI